MSSSASLSTLVNLFKVGRWRRSFQTAPRPPMGTALCFHERPLRQCSSCRASGREPRAFRQPALASVGELSRVLCSESPRSCRCCGTMSFWTLDLRRPQLYTVVVRTQFLAAGLRSRFVTGWLGAPRFLAHGPQHSSALLNGQQGNLCVGASHDVT